MLIMLLIISTSLNHCLSMCPLLEISEHTCRYINEKYWNLIRFYFRSSRTPYIEITEISESQTEFIDEFSFIALDLYNQTHNVITLQRVDLSFEQPATRAESYSWQGKIFPKRTIGENRVKRTTVDTSNSFSKKMMTTRIDESDKGNLIIAESATILNEYLFGTARKPFNQPRGNFILFIANTNYEENYEKDVNEIMAKLWNDYGIINYLLIAPCAHPEKLIGYYDPFAANVDALTKTKIWGQLQWYSLNQTAKLISLILRKSENFNGLPLRVTLFPRYPTAMKRNDLPNVFLNSYYANIMTETKDLGGFDALVLGNVARKLNFQPVVMDSIEKFGYNLDNGTFIGSLGDILYRKSYASFNGRFISNYNTSEIEFMFPTFADKLCILCPKAFQIPQWMAIFKCFKPKVWIVFVCVNTLCGYFWYLIRRISIRLSKIFLEVNSDANDNKNKFHMFVTEMWIIMLAGPSMNLPSRIVERIFLCSCLVANIIIAGSFQGSLTKSFSTTSYYKDIDTLADLDASGYDIGTTSQSLKDVFGHDGTKILESLNTKYHIISTPAIDRAAFNRDICCVERFADAKVVKVVKFEANDGSSLLHIVNQCPRVYHLAYIVKKGWTLLSRFSLTLCRFFEAGLLEKWYQIGANSIITQYKIKNRKISENSFALQAFTLADMQTAFYILGIGYLLCFVIFTFEILLHNKF